MLDDAKHYWVSPDEVDKLVRSGSGWLAAHPNRELITRRYLAHRKTLTRSALARLAEVDDADTERFDDAAAAPEVGDDPDRPVPLAEQRRGAVLAALRSAQATSVADLGCGEGTLAGRAAGRPHLPKIVATDVSVRSLEIAARKLRLETMRQMQRERLHSSSRH